MRILSIIITLFLVISSQAHGESRGAPKQSGGHAARQTGNYYALIIGNNNYLHAPKLETAVSDAIAIEKILSQKYSFKTRLLLDATRKDILNAINDFRRILEENDNFLVYYAGHGEYDRVADKAYWLPVNAEQENPVDWIMADDITSNIKRLASKHVLIMSDSCYSGALTRATSTDLKGKGNRKQYLTKMMERPSRTIMSSGGNEPVADAGGSGNHSVFALFEPRSSTATASLPVGLIARPSGASPTTTLSITRGGLASRSMTDTVSTLPSEPPALPLSAVRASLPSGVMSRL